MDLVENHDLADETGYPQHHVLGPGRGEQQLVDRPDHQMGQQPALGPQEPLGRR
ncbi:hypothetical protein [Actinocorallia lasiicapitis]